MSITDIIKPITLLAGSHEDTGTTGQGCIMNVIAYLNGEAQITDNSPCVCVTIKRPLIWFNDFLRSNERQELIRYIERAMGSATQDFDVVRKRLDLLVVFAGKMFAVAAATATDAATAAAAATATDAAAAAATATDAAAAATAATYAAIYAAYTESMRHEVKTIAFEFFDAALPPSPQFDDCVLNRAKELAELA